MPDRAWRSGPLHPALVLLPYPQPGRAPARQTPGSRDSTHRKERVTSRSVSRGQSPAAPEVCVGTARPALGISRPPQRAPTPPPQFRSVPGCSWPRGCRRRPYRPGLPSRHFPVCFGQRGGRAGGHPVRGCGTPGPRCQGAAGSTGLGRGPVTGPVRSGVAAPRARPLGIGHRAQVGAWAVPGPQTMATSLSHREVRGPE